MVVVSSKAVIMIANFANISIIQSCLNNKRADDVNNCHSNSGKCWQVTAGTVNYEGPITIRATSTGTDSALAGIGRLVADAQAREAPVQRLADAVAGKFCYSVMAASAATLAFWSLAGGSRFFWILDSALTCLLKQHLCYTPCCCGVWVLLLCWQAGPVSYVA